MPATLPIRSLNDLYAATQRTSREKQSVGASGLQSASYSASNPNALKRFGAGVRGAATGLAGVPATGISTAGSGIARGTDAIGLTNNATEAWDASTKTLANLTDNAWKDVGRTFLPESTVGSKSRLGGHEQQLAQTARQQGSPWLATGMEWANEARDFGLKSLAPTAAISRAAPAVTGAYSKMPGSSYLSQAGELGGKLSIPAAALWKNPTSQSSQSQQQLQPSQQSAQQGGLSPYIAKPQPANEQAVQPQQQPQPQPQPQPTGQGNQPAPDNQPVPDADQGGESESILPNILPNYDEIKQLVTEMPEKAQEFASQATEKLTSYFDTDFGKQEANNVATNGSVSPEAAEAGMTALTEEGFDWDTAKNVFSNMNGWEQFGLVGGLGLGALGLLQAISGQGGVGSLIMSLLGLGTAAATAGGAGLLDQGSQDLVQGAGKAMGLGGEQSSMLPEGLSNVLPEGLQSAFGDNMRKAVPWAVDNLGKEGVQPILGALAKANPEITKQLDAAAGTGSWGNSVLGWLGDVTGKRQQMMQDKLGLNPEQQEKLISWYRDMVAE